MATLKNTATKKRAPGDLRRGDKPGTRAPLQGYDRFSSALTSEAEILRRISRVISGSDGKSPSRDPPRDDPQSPIEDKRKLDVESSTPDTDGINGQRSSKFDKHVPTRRLSRQWDKEILHIGNTGPWPHEEGDSGLSGRASLDASDFEKSSPDSSTFSPMTGPLHAAGVEGVVPTTPTREAEAAATPDIYAAVPCTEQQLVVPSCAPSAVQDDATSAFEAANLHRDGEFELGPESESTMFTVSQTYEKRIPLGWKIKARSLAKIDKPKGHHKPLAPASSAATFSSTKTTSSRRRSKGPSVPKTTSSTFSIAEKVNAVVKNARALMRRKKSVEVIKKKSMKTIHDKNMENSDKSLKSVDLIAVAKERRDLSRAGVRQSQLLSNGLPKGIRKLDSQQLEGILSLDAPVYFFQPSLGDKMLLRDPLWKRKTDFRIVTNMESRREHSSKSALLPAPIPRGRSPRKPLLPQKVAVLSAPNSATPARRASESPAAKYQRHVQRLRRLSREHEKKAWKSPVPHGSKVLKRSSEEMKILSNKGASGDLFAPAQPRASEKQVMGRGSKRGSESRLSKGRSRSAKSSSKSVDKDHEETTKTNTITKDEGLGSDSSIQLTKRAYGGASRVMINDRGRFVVQDIRRRRRDQRGLFPQLNRVLSAGNPRRQHVIRRPFDLSDFVPDRVGLREALYGAEEVMRQRHDGEQANRGYGDVSEMKSSSSVSLPDELSGKFEGGAYDYEPPSAQRSSSSSQKPSGRRDALGFTNSHEKLLGSSGKTSSGKSRARGALIPSHKGQPVFRPKFGRLSSSVGHRSQRRNSLAYINPRAVGMRHKRHHRLVDPQEHIMDPHERHHQAHRPTNGPEFIGLGMPSRPRTRPSATNVAALEDPHAPPGAYEAHPGVHFLHRDGNAARNALLQRLRVSKSPRQKKHQESFRLQHLAVPPSSTTTYSPGVSSIHTSSGELLPAGKAGDEVSRDAILEDERARLMRKSNREGGSRRTQDLGKISPRHDSDVPEVSASDATATNHTLSRDPFDYCEEEQKQQLLPPSPTGQPSNTSGGTPTVPPGSSASGFFASIGPRRALEAASSFFRKSLESINYSVQPVVHESTFATAPTGVAANQQTIPPGSPAPHARVEAKADGASKDDTVKNTPQQGIKDETEHDEVSEHQKTAGWTQEPGDDKGKEQDKDVGRGQGGAASSNCSQLVDSDRYQAGSNDGGRGCDKADVALLMLEQVKSILGQMKTMRDEVIYLKEDVDELQFMHDCCGIDELITSRFKAKFKTAYPAAPPECYENTVDGFRWMAYKNILNLWTLEYIDDIIQKRKADKKGIHAKGSLFLDKRMEFFCDAPDLFYAKDFFQDVQNAEYTLATLVRQINAFEKTVPGIVAAGSRIACSWKQKPHLQEAIRALAEYLRCTNASDSSTVHMFEQMIPGDPFDAMRILLAKEDGVTEITETTGQYRPAFTPKKGEAVNYCEAKKLIHFLKYRHLHPAHKWPKKNKGGSLKAGSAGVEVDRDYELDLNDAEIVGQAEKERLFDMRSVALKHGYKGMLGARKFQEEFQRRAKTTLFQITQFLEWVGQLHTDRDPPKPLDVADIFPNFKMLQDFDAARALLFNQPINMEKYGMPSERAVPQTFR